MQTIFTSFLKWTVFLLIVFVLPISATCQIPSESLAWKFSSGDIYSAPLVVNDTVFIGDMNGKFSALHADNGQEIWSYQAETYIASHAAYKNGIVIFEAGDRLHGLNAQTGELLWSYRSTDKVSTPGSVTGFHHSSPVIEGNSAYFGDEWGNMNGVDVTTGELVFQYHIPFTYTTASAYNIRSTPVIKDSIIYFGDYAANIYAIYLKDKSEKWIQKMETPRWDGSVVSDMVIDNNVLYCGRYTNSLTPLDLETGKQLWKFTDQDTYLPSTPVFYKNNVIIGTTISSNHIYALDKATGTKNWELNVKGIFFVKPIIIQDSILVMNSTDPFTDHVGVLHFIDLNRGKMIHEIYLPNSTESSPIQYKDKILIGKNDGLYAIDYKPLLVPPGPSSFNFDATPENLIINKNEVFYKTYMLTNTGTSFDDVTVQYEKDGDPTINRMIFSDITNLHVRPDQQVEICIHAKANSFKPGNYTIKIRIVSARQTDDSPLEKTINLSVLNPTGLNDEITAEGRCLASPNPFLNNVLFDLKGIQESKIELTIHSLNGELVYSENIQKPVESFLWNGRNRNNVPVQSGVYIYQVSSGEHKTSGKLIKN